MLPQSQQCWYLTWYLVPRGAEPKEKEADDDDVFGETTGRGGDENDEPDQEAPLSYMPSQVSYPHIQRIRRPWCPSDRYPTVVRGLVEEAPTKVLICSYVFHDAKDLLSPLAERMDSDPAFELTIITDISHSRKNNEPAPIVINRFSSRFLTHSWPGKRSPHLRHDPRALVEPDRSKSGVMHAKTVIIDDTAAFVTSANFTQAAQDRNIEAGAVLRHHIHVRKLRNFFEGLMAMNYLVRLV